MFALLSLKKKKKTAARQQSEYVARVQSPAPGEKKMASLFSFMNPVFVPTVASFSSPTSLFPCDHLHKQTLLCAHSCSAQCQRHLSKRVRVLLASFNAQAVFLESDFFF